MAETQTEGRVVLTPLYAQKVEHFRVSNFHIAEEVGVGARYMEITSITRSTDLEDGEVTYEWGGYLTKKDGTRFARGTHRGFILYHDVEAEAIERLRREAGLE